MQFNMSAGKLRFIKTTSSLPKVLPMPWNTRNTLQNNYTSIALPYLVNAQPTLASPLPKPIYKCTTPTITPASPLRLSKHSTCTSVKVFKANRRINSKSIGSKCESINRFLNLCKKTAHGNQSSYDYKLENSKVLSARLCKAVQYLTHYHSHEKNPLNVDKLLNSPMNKEAVILGNESVSNYRYRHEKNLLSLHAIKLIIRRKNRCAL